LVLSEEVVFTLTSGRSGTLTLSEMLKLNTRLQDCQADHEPYFQWGNPNMFGRPVYDFATGNLTELRRVTRLKSATIARLPSRVYVESNHAFLKSYWSVAPEFFPRMKVVHLIRHPLKVARSEANRDKDFVACIYYMGRDWRWYKYWALTGLEPIYQPYALQDLTLFQRYVIQWIEVENRAMAFRRQFNFDTPDKCLTLYSPKELNEPAVVPKVLDFIGVAPSQPEARLPGKLHETWGAPPTVVGDTEMREFHEVLEKMPSSYLEIFKHAPYDQCDWVELFRK
jgi:hypothetical protein